MPSVTRALVCCRWWSSLRADILPSIWRANLSTAVVADVVIDRVAYEPYMMHIEGAESMRK